MLNLRHTQHGVTLIELMIGLVIFGILFTMGVPAYSGWIQNQQIRTAAESMLNGIQMTRSEAVKNNAPARFVLCDAVSSWQVLAVTSTAAAAPAADTICGAGAANEIRVQDRTGLEGSKQAQVAVTPSGATTVTFNSLGRVVTNADASASIIQIDVSTPTGTRPLRITVGTGGNTKMCDPSPLLATNDPRHC
jgi:type IV fimbrial biogenesis protein FimT